MKIERVKKAAELRGIYFEGRRRWRNNTVGNAYEITTPNGRGFFQSDTLEGIYREVMKYERIK